MPQNSETVSTKRRRIPELARQSPEMAFTSLAYLMDIDWLREAYHQSCLRAAILLQGGGDGLRQTGLPRLHR